MYKYIEKNRGALLARLKEDNMDNYLYLLNPKRDVNKIDYQKKYKNFWRLYAARLSNEFCENHFQVLKKEIQNPSGDLKKIVTSLAKVPSNKAREVGSLHFSFSTKLLHVANPETPIYDKMVKEFYFFSEPKPKTKPKSKTEFEDRLEKVNDFYDFLIDEYERIRTRGLLAKSMKTFRKEFKSNRITDVKIIDTMIWLFVDYLRKEAALRKDFFYD